MVIEGDGPDAERHATAAIEARAAAGRRVVDGLAAAGPATLCVTTIATSDDARLALLAALGGAALVVRATGSRETIDAFLDDLRRLGSVDHVTADRASPPHLDREQRALIALLGEGLTLGQAAAVLGLARRTADRRLAAARAILGVQTTAEAIVAAHREPV